MSLPTKLKNDAISEALFEVRFESDESQKFPEAVLSKLSDYPKWRNFEIIRSPLSDIPFAIRIQDPNLKRQPSMELHEHNKQSIVKIGTHTISFHRRNPYPGWESFKPELHDMLEYLFGLFRNFRATRLGLRYINMFTSEHGVNSVADLNYSVSVAGSPLLCPQNINYIAAHGDKLTATVRIASPEFFGAPVAGGVSAVDIDVYTGDRENIREKNEICDWLEAAHDVEKQEFFNLFTDDMKSRLVEH